MMAEEYQVTQQDDKTGKMVSYRYTPPTNVPSDKADLLDKINPDLIVEEIKNKLMGMKFEKGKWVEDERLRSRALTYIGAHEIAVQLLSISNRNTSITKLEKDQIRNRALNKARTIMRMCLDNWEEYGIKSVSQLHSIHDLCFDIILIILNQPLEEGIRNLIKGVRSETASFGSDIAQKRGIISGILRR